MDVRIDRLLILVIFGFLATGDLKKSISRFTNLKCESYDLNFSKFQNCRLKVIGRGIVAANLHINLLQVPIHNVSTNWSMWRRYSGYKPFLYNATIDFCKLLKQSKKKSFEGLILEVIVSHSNLNHPCPITNDIIMDNTVFNDTFLQSLPLPQGDYKIQLRFATKNIWRFQIEIFFFRNE